MERRGPDAAVRLPQRQQRGGVRRFSCGTDARCGALMKPNISGVAMCALALIAEVPANLKMSAKCQQFVTGERKRPPTEAAYKSFSIHTCPTNARPNERCSSAWRANMNPIGSVIGRGMLVAGLLISAGSALAAGS